MAGNWNRFQKYLDAKDVCSSCRGGYTGCDCWFGCMECRTQRMQAYNFSMRNHGVMVKYYMAGCRCSERFCCESCVMSLKQCRRGGCIRYLPNPSSEEAKPYKAIFNAEDHASEEDGPIPAKTKEDTDGDSVIDSLEALAIEGEKPGKQPIRCNSVECKSLSSDDETPEGESTDSGNISVTGSADESS